MFQRTTIGKQFTATCAVLLTLLSSVAVMALFNVKSTIATINSFLGDSVPGLYYASQIQAKLRHFSGDCWAHIASSDETRMRTMEAEMEKIRGELDKDIQGYEASITQADDRAAFSKLRPAWEAYQHAWDSVLPASRAGKNAEATLAYVQQVEPVFNQLRDIVDDRMTWNKQYADRTGAEALSSAVTVRTITWGVALFSLGLGVLLTLSIVRSFTSKLRGAVTELRAGAVQVAAAAEQVASSSQSLAQGSSEQAASLEETSAATEQINSMARRNAESCAQAATLAAETQTKFSGANASLDLMVAAMNEINGSSEKIAKIIKVIDEIAFQTNILALNAAVEAARAGEAGMGFAVVADEVRNLAQRCAQAAKDTASLIDDSIAKSTDGKTKMDQVASAIRDVAEDVAKVKAIVETVNAGSDEQTRGIVQISRTISEMSNLTQSTASSAEEGASAAEELTAQSEAVKDVVAQLSILVDGRA